MLRTLFSLRIWKWHCSANSKLITTYTKSSFSRFAKSGSQEYHCLPKLVSFKNMKVSVLSALQDNYMYLIIDELAKKAAVVDPVEPDVVLRSVDKEGVVLTTVLTTHHHWDHAGGNKKLLQMMPNLEVVGGDERIEGLTKLVTDNDIIKVGNLNIKCLSTPCHTKGHICYYISLENEPSAVFTGDTLFAGGCGRFFEGSAEQMYTALIEKLGSLPDDTKVFCGHEYTVNNLKFARKIEPENPHIKKKLEWAQKQRTNNMPTIPSTIGEEKQTNPFMRVIDTEIQSITGYSNPVHAMKLLRDQKDNFKDL